MPNKEFGKVNLPHPDGVLITDLQERIDDELRKALGGATEVALVNFHSISAGWPQRPGNPGDMAIWLGAYFALERLGVKVVYQCAYNTLSLAALRRALPFGPVLITGGGDFGDLYTFATPETRERLLAELRGVPIVQLPISVYLRQASNIRRIRRLVDEHNNFILMTRDKLSEARARDHFDTDIRLVPDLAFSLGPQHRLTSPDVNVVWNMWHTSDEEFVDHGPPPEGRTNRAIEWSRRVEVEPPWRLQHRLARRVHIHLGRKMHRWPALRGPLWRPFAATLQPLCAGSISRGLRLLSSGEVVITNKLHGHILATLAGIPNVVLDNSFGKVSGVYETWTSGSSLAHWANSGEEARKIAADLTLRGGSET